MDEFDLRFLNVVLDELRRKGQKRGADERDLVDAVAATAGTLFYVATEHAPNVDEDGLPVIFKLPVGRDEVYVLHPENLSRLEAYAERLGRSLAVYAPEG